MDLASPAVSGTSVYANGLKRIVIYLYLINDILRNYTASVTGWYGIMNCDNVE